MRRAALLAPLVAVPLLAPAAATAASAGEAGGPQWQISIVPAPESFTPSVDQVDEVVVKGSGGTFTLGLPEAGSATIACGASAATVQQKLDELPELEQERAVGGGHGEVTVSGTPACSEANATPYVITFTGGLGGEALPPLEASANALEGTTHTAEVSVASEGAPVGGDQYVLTATNVGGAASAGQVEIEDVLPAGVSLRSVTYPTITGTSEHAGESYEQKSLACSSPPATTVTCTYSEPVAAGDMLTAILRVDVPEAPLGGELEDRATLSEGGVERAREALSTPVTGAAARFGFASFAMSASTAQAGAHPNLTTSFTIEQSQANGSAATIKHLELSLPPGLIGNPRAVSQCNAYALKTSGCPESAAVGVASVHAGCNTSPVYFGVSRCRVTFPTLVYNIKPYQGEPAAFAFRFIQQFTVRIDTSLVRDAAGEYAVRASAQDIDGGERALDATVTLWGAPAEHNGAGASHVEGGSFGGAGAEAHTARPFLTNASQCEAPLRTQALTSSWEEPNVEAPASSSLIPESIEQSSEPTEGRMTGCGLLAPLFAPKLEAAPTSAQANAPTGLEVHLKVPQNEAPESPATPDLRDATVTLPQGMVASPSFASGLQVCSDQEFDEGSSEPASCPPASEIGEVEILTPLLEKPLTGQVFLGEPKCSPCSKAQAGSGELVRLFLQAQYEDGEYVRIKLAGRTRISQTPATLGQLTTTFENNPQAPFEVLRLKLYGGEDAPLANPSTCGTQTVTSALTPWSSTSSEPFTAEPPASFQVEGCTTPSFSPAFSAGMTGSGHGGSYSPFSVSFSRTDSDEDLSAITVRTPPGLLGMVSHVTQCGEAEANEGTCPASSEIGAVTAAVGPGADRYWVTGGKAFLTGPFHGEPFGLSIVVPAKAGPFTLAGENALGQEGHGAVVIRASIAVSPYTSALTITSNPMPQEIDGIPLQVRTVNVDVDRPEFMRNATNCEAQAITASVASAQGAVANVSSPYQANDCASLAFKPSFAAETHAYHSRKAGSYLKVTIKAGEGEANLAKVRVTLPKKLPADLDTLKEACTEAQFDANPAGCPPASFVGSVLVHTPVLSKPLEGPAIYVAHGHATEPDLALVLQGEGVTIIQEGSTNIHSGFTTSSFEAIPDVPVSSVEVTLPEGEKPALGGNGGNLCTTTKTKRVKVHSHGKLVTRKRKVKKKLTLDMPTRITGQNGAVVEQEIALNVSGCAVTHAKAKKMTKKRAR